MYFLVPDYYSGGKLSETWFNNGACVIKHRFSIKLEELIPRAMFRLGLDKNWLHSTEAVRSIR